MLAAVVFASGVEGRGKTYEETEKLMKDTHLKNPPENSTLVKPNPAELPPLIVKKPGS